MIQTTINLTKIKQRTVEQVVNIHAQHDVRAVKMEQSKIIKNTVQRTNPIIQEKINQVLCKSNFAAFKLCKNRGKAARMGHLPCQCAKISANDAKGTEYQSGEFREHSLRCIDQMTVQMLKEQKEHPDTLWISTDPVHTEKTHDEQS